MIIFLGISVLTLDFFLYSSLLPSTISQDKLKQIEATAYAFYALFASALLTVGYGIHALIFRVYGKMPSPLPDVKKSVRSPLILAVVSIFKMAIAIMTDRRYYKYFWIIGAGYGIVYGIVSGLLILHQKGFVADYGVDVPSITIMSYGPTGYVPALAIYATDNIGMFIVPLNLLVIIIISALVGFNGALTVYAVRKRLEGSLMTKSRPYSLVNLAASMLALFAVCPTCASFYIFAVLAGSLAPSIAAFTVAFYTLFLGISIPLLIGSSLVTLYGICKMQDTKTCSLR
jgi:hypothetical protein